MDKDIVLVISEMLIKQDETTLQIKQLSLEVKETTMQVKEVAEQIRETNSILKDFMGVSKDFMGVSIKQWEQQQVFNETAVNELKEKKGLLSTLALLDTRLKAVEERESKFESRLAYVERLLKA